MSGSSRWIARLTGSSRISRRRESGSLRFPRTARKLPSSAGIRNRTRCCCGTCRGKDRRSRRRRLLRRLKAPVGNKSLSTRSVSLRQPHLPYQCSKPRIGAQGIETWLRIQPNHADGARLIRLLQPLERVVLLSQCGVSGCDFVRTDVSLCHLNLEALFQGTGACRFPSKRQYADGRRYINGSGFRKLDWFNFLCSLAELSLLHFGERNVGATGVAAGIELQGFLSLIDRAVVLPSHVEIETAVGQNRQRKGIKFPRKLILCECLIPTSERGEKICIVIVRQRVVRVQFQRTLQMLFR